MSAPQFTPGPWSIRKTSRPHNETVHWRELLGADGNIVIGELFENGGERDEPTPDEAEANGHLITAAPELYEALDDVLIHVLADIEAEERKDEPNEAALTVFRARRNKAQAALAKARGEQ